MIDDKTPNLQLPLPNKQNLLSTDVERIAEALKLIDKSFGNLQQALEDFKSDIGELNEADRVAIQVQFAALEQINADAIKSYQEDINKIKILAMAGL